MRKLAINITFKPTGGVLAQVNQLILNIDSYDFNQIVFYSTRDNAHLFENITSNKVTLKYVLFSSKSIIFRTIWEQLLLPFLLFTNQIDLLFCPGNISPIINTKKKVQWIHTIGPFEKNFISSFSFRKRCVLIISKYLIILSSHTSDMVIFDSNYTMNLFISKFSQKKEKSYVIHSGNDEFFKPINTKTSNVFSHVKNNNFILTVSHLYPYKNIELLLESYFNLKLHEKDLYIIVAGSISDEIYYKKLKLLVQRYGISKYVLFLGRLEIDGLRELYSNCKMFVFTSPFENFAYTLIEAMSCSAAIISTNTTAMPESCGNSALYFSPNSQKELSDCIMIFLNDEKKRLQYKDLALSKSKEYPFYADVNIRTNTLLTKLF